MSKRFTVDDALTKRFDRQLSISGWGTAAQKRIAASRIGIAGVGGLGSPAALYLAAAGVGALTLCDSHSVDISNLNRQILYSSADVGCGKTGLAKERLTGLNPDVEIETFQGRLNEENIGSVFNGCDLVLDCFDNLDSRLMLNRYCWKTGKPLIHAGIREFYGELFMVNPPDTPCLSCFLPGETKEQDGHPPVSGPVAGVMGSLQAAEALKFLGKIAPCRSLGELLLVDLIGMTLDSVPISRRSGCPVCAAEPDRRVGK